MGLVPLLWLRHCRLVLQATNRKSVVLAVVAGQVGEVQYVQIHVVGAVAIDLRGTPKVGENADLNEFAHVIACRERGKAVGICAIPV